MSVFFWHGMHFYWLILSPKCSSVISCARIFFPLLARNFFMDKVHNFYFFYSSPQMHSTLCSSHQDTVNIVDWVEIPRVEIYLNESYRNKHMKTWKCLFLPQTHLYFPHPTPFSKAFTVLDIIKQKQKANTHCQTELWEPSKVWFRELVREPTDSQTSAAFFVVVVMRCDFGGESVLNTIPGPLVYRMRRIIPIWKGCPEGYMVSKKES